MSFRTSSPTPPRQRAGVPLAHPDHHVPPAADRRRPIPVADVVAAEAATALHIAPAGHELPGFERWLQVLLAACVPAVGALWAPQAWRIPMLAVAAITCIVALVLLAQQMRRPGSAPR